MQLALASQLREISKPFSDIVYAPVQNVADLLDEPVDQAIYFCALIASFVACLILGQIENV